MAGLKVFISWSGNRSLMVAEALRDFLKVAHQQVRPFISSQDTRLGGLWHRQLGRELADSEHGILCITKDNVSAPWLLFEAGALSKTIIDSGALWLLPIDPMSPKELPSPVQHFQGSTPDEAGVYRLFQAINAKLGDSALDDSHLRQAFDRSWPEFATVLQQAQSTVAPARPTGTWDLFIASPMASVDATEFAATRELSLAVKEAFKDHLGLQNIYYAGEDATADEDFDEPQFAALNDLGRLRKSERFVLVLPKSVATGALVESGFALAHKIPSIYFVPSENTLPYNLRKAAEVYSHVYTMTYRSPEHLVSIIAKHGHALFPNTSTPSTNGTAP